VLKWLRIFISVSHTINFTMSSQT